MTRIASRIHSARSLGVLAAAALTAAALAPGATAPTPPAFFGAPGAAAPPPANAVKPDPAKAPAPAKPAPKPQVGLNPRDVDAAIEKAVAYLLSQQQKDGSWEVAPKMAAGGKGAGHAWGGETAICTYALLASGVSPQEPAIKKAVEWLENEDLHGTYAVGLRSQVWNLLPEKTRTRPVIEGRERDKEYVLWARAIKGANKGFYGYLYGTESALSPTGAPKQPLSHAGGGGGDRSNSQYGVLGAWALEQAGAEIPTSYWLEEDEAWKKDQNADGGWAYGGHGGESTVTMTAAGIATLFVTQDYVMRSNAHQFDACKGGVTNPNLDRGLAWMDKHAVAALNGGPYGLYGIERIGVASGRKYFGIHDWYKMGASRLVKIQGATGSWGALHDTCFCTLFLVRGRAPVMMNKLMYESAAKQTDPWNERPRDAANLAKWMGKHSLEGFLNWQIVNLEVPVDELHDAPILYLSGSQELLLSNQDIAKLRQFVEQGGMLLGNADCGSKAFAASFTKLGQKLFPKYEFRKLPTSHLIFDEQYHASKWKAHPVVEGMSNGVRELLILIPQVDPAHAWQTESTKTREESFQLAGNIFLYATGKENLTHKGDTYIVHPEGPASKVEIKVARLEVGENWDPEPGAWRRLAAVMHNSRQVEIKADPVKLGAGLLTGYKVAHLTGTTPLNLSAAQGQELKDYVDKGGTLIIDAAGGSTEFADSAEVALKRIWGTAAANAFAAPLPPDHLLFSTPGAIVNRIVYRTFARRTLLDHIHDPRIRAIAVGEKGRLGVFYSREDLTEGLVGEAVDGIVGYSPENATQLMSNMVMYAELGGIVVVPPATKPTTLPATRPATLPAGKVPVKPAAKPPAPGAPPVPPTAPPVPAPPAPPAAPTAPPAPAPPAPAPPAPPAPPK